MTRPTRWTAVRLLAMLLLVGLNVSVATGMYLFLGSNRSALAIQAGRPGEHQPAANAAIERLPGTLYVAQQGTLYRLQHGTFTPVLKAGGWMQPAFTADGKNLVVVKRDSLSSDVYQVDLAGRVQSQLTHTRGRDTGSSHWAFYARPAPDGATLFLSYDPKDRDNFYNVVLAVWSMPIGGQFTQATRWTTPTDYTGGDVQPQPLPDGGVVYTKYAYAGERVVSQLWLTTRPGDAGRALTPPEDGCAQPALSTDGRLAMVCSGGRQVTTIEVASLSGTTLGPRTVVASGQQAAQATWAPDGSGLGYIAPAGVAGLFQLWWQPLGRQAALTPRPDATSTPPTPAPGAAPVQLTTDLDFDATSSIAWR